ncbi:MAG: hypothetical protein EPN25_00850 [Nitrospirae bacterium]|nr:MAG: hypothetical protein EPN25_00850 [Nitrospirota bacterium]
MKKLAVLITVVWLMSAGVSFGYQARETVEVDLVTGQGEVLQVIPHKYYEADRMQVIKKYLEARQGQTYSIVIRNNSPERIGVVVAVDGRNIITGKKSWLKNSEMMYIIAPYGSTRLDGWRTDNSTIHQFYFTDPGDSYTVRTFNDTSAMGVIAVAAFKEKEPYRYPYQEQRSLGKAPGPAAGAMPQRSAKDALSESAATGFGQERYSPVVRVEFEPQQTAFQKTLLKYEWRETLCRKGLLRCGGRDHNRLWDEGGYAPFPPGYDR